LAQLKFWGVIASPYQLKMQALADFAGHSWRRYPDQASFIAGVGMMLRLERARKAASIRRLPDWHPSMDEYPAVPFFTEDGEQFFYDSTGLAHYLDHHSECHDRPLIPAEPEAIRFICQLIDEAFDEFGLYMVHHQRWVTSAHTNVMGRMTATEMAPSGLRRALARRLSRRQVRRLPYLFSVAQEGFDIGIKAPLTPPSRSGFPPTHELLDSAWRLYLAAMESLLQQQPYLLGDRFTLADASAYGQLSMNLVDGAAADKLAKLAPTTFQWLCDIRDGRHIGSHGSLYLSDELRPLIAVITETFIPLMQQNLAAYQAALESGETIFNEAAFDQARSLYDGELQGYPFRSVAKSFQVPVWRDICAQWASLPVQDRRDLGHRYPVLNGVVFSP
jgi:glutathione S-transferase